MTQFYVGVKIVEAWEERKNGAPGYAVKYQDGYMSWSPETAFEEAFYPMGTDRSQAECALERAKSAIALPAQDASAILLGGEIPVRIRSVVNGFRRAGMVHSSDWKEYTLVDFSPEQILALIEEPKLQVKFEGFENEQVVRMIRNEMSKVAPPAAEETPAVDPPKSDEPMETETAKATRKGKK